MHFEILSCTHHGVRYICICLWVRVFGLPKNAHLLIGISIRGLSLRKYVDAWCDSRKKSINTRNHTISFQTKNHREFFTYFSFSCLGPNRCWALFVYLGCSAISNIRFVFGIKTFEAIRLFRKSKQQQKIQKVLAFRTTFRVFSSLCIDCSITLFVRCLMNSDIFVALEYFYAHVRRENRAYERKKEKERECIGEGAPRLSNASESFSCIFIVEVHFNWFNSTSSSMFIPYTVDTV